MKYIEAIVLVLGFPLGAILGSFIPMGDGSAAVFGTLLVPTFGLLILFLFKKKRKVLSLEERTQQKQLMHQHTVESSSVEGDLFLYAAQKFRHPISPVQ